MIKPKKLAKETGIFDSAEMLGTWKEFNVYIASSKTPVCVGLPQYILEEEKKDARWASPEETIELMSIFCV